MMLYLIDYTAIFLSFMYNILKYIKYIFTYCLIIYNLFKNISCNTKLNLAKTNMLRRKNL